jgi:hypothetical protein
MGSEHIGYVEFQDHFFRFRSARCSYHNGRLYVAAEGDKCKLCLPGVPFPGACAISDLPGRGYDSNAEAVHSTGMSEGQIEVGKFHLSFRRLKVKCKNIDSTTPQLALSLQAEVEDCVNGGGGEVDCGVRCEIEVDTRSF